MSIRNFSPTYNVRQPIRVDGGFGGQYNTANSVMSLVKNDFTNHIAPRKVIHAQHIHKPSMLDAGGAKAAILGRPPRRPQRQPRPPARFANEGNGIRHGGDEADVFEDDDSDVDVPEEHVPEDNAPADDVPENALPENNVPALAPVRTWFEAAAAQPSSRC